MKLLRQTVCLLFVISASVLGHNPAFDPPPPTTVPEAWNVISQCTRNIQPLIDTNQLREIPYQIANNTTAIRLLQQQASAAKDPAKAQAGLTQLLNAGAGVVIASRQTQKPLDELTRSYQAYQDVVRELAAQYPREVVNADVFICPMHPKDRHLDSDAKCSLCKMSLIKRRIVASSIYQAPGEASMVMEAHADAPLEPGKRASVKIKLAHRDGSPIVPKDLMVMHTERIHLLIVDPSLDDYHHEHPTRTDTSGEYEFSFTPRKSGPYRIFADLVPVETSMQEYVVADLPSDQKGGAITDRETRWTADLDGMNFKLTFDTKDGVLRAGEPILGQLGITGADGKPFRALEPVTGAFGHFVGFSEDYKTVVHIHPAGPEPTEPHHRGGPNLPFFLYAPNPGYMRFYVQVRVDGKDRFVPFGLNIEASPTLKP